MEIDFEENKYTTVKLFCIKFIKIRLLPVFIFVYIFFIF